MTPRHIPEGGLVGNVLLYTGLALVATGLVITAVGGSVTLQHNSAEIGPEIRPPSLSLSLSLVYATEIIALKKFLNEPVY